MPYPVKLREKLCATQWLNFLILAFNILIIWAHEY
jgi:hypothetical protein